MFYKNFMHGVIINAFMLNGTSYSYHLIESISNFWIVCRYFTVLFNVEAAQSLYSLREKISLQYAIRFAANPSHPAHEVTFSPNYVDLYEQKPKTIKSFDIRISPLLESAYIKP